ncbi:MAG: CsiV family protein [Methylococcaceae bacterium]
MAKNSYKRCLRITSFFCFLIMYGEAFSGQRRFQIEVIVFTHNQPTSEQFEITKNLTKWPDGLVNLGGKTAASLGFTTPMNHLRTLTDELKGLKQSGRFVPVIYEAWEQSVYSNTKGSPVHLFVGEVRGLSRRHRIDGYVQLQRGHYLFMKVDMELLGQELGVDDVSFPAVYRVNERRRIKLNEVHYFDHPKFGLLTQVIPLEGLID